MELLKEYFEKQKELYDYFGYEENWVVIPVNNCTGYYWSLSGEGYGDSVYFAQYMEDFADGEYYSDGIYTQRFLPKWVYRGKDYTMVVVDTHTDGNKFLQIFDNSLEVPYDEISEYF